MIQPYEVTLSGGQSIDAAHPVPTGDSAVLAQLVLMLAKLGAVTLDASTLAALESITVTVSNFPAIAHLDKTTDSVTVGNFPAVAHLSAATDSVTVANFPPVAHLDKTTDSVTVGNFPAIAHLAASTDSVAVLDQRGLVERMLAKAPAPGYHLWLDVTSSDPASIFIAEAKDGKVSSAAEFSGIRVQLKDGVPFGAVLTATGFIWDNRANVATVPPAAFVPTVAWSA